MEGTPEWERAGVAATSSRADSFANEIDDWLNPLPCVEGEGELMEHTSPFLSEEVFPTTGALELAPKSAAEELDDYFEPRATQSLRASFSMNDLQSLQSTVTTAVGGWGHHRTASIRPLLESVPEGAPTEGGTSLLPYNKDGFLASALDGLEFVTPTQDECSLSAACPAASSGQAYSSSMAPFNHDQRPAAALMNTTGRGSVPRLAPPAAGSESLHNTALSLWSAHGGQSRPHPSGYAAESREHHMPDKQEHGCDTDSSGNTSGNTMVHQQLRPTGAALRKSQSALELGAWRKMAAGDMDFIDPGGSVREQLMGLEFKSVGLLTPEERLQKILRYRAKRQMRNFNRIVKYQCRKSLADTRPRVRGRFARDNEPGSVMPHETKKAMRDKAKPKAKGGAGLGAGADSPVVKLEPVSASQPPAHLATFASCTPPVAATCPPPPVVEHHAAALAHLYNQWGHDPYEFGMESKPML